MQKKKREKQAFLERINKGYILILLLVNKSIKPIKTSETSDGSKICFVKNANNLQPQQPKLILVDKKIIASCILQVFLNMKIVILSLEV